MRHQLWIVPAVVCLGLILQGCGEKTSTPLTEDQKIQISTTEKTWEVLKPRLEELKAKSGDAGKEAQTWIEKIDAGLKSLRAQTGKEFDTKFAEIQKWIKDAGATVGNTPSPKVPGS